MENLQTILDKEVTNASILFDSILSEAINRNVSDIHINPRCDQSTISFRIDGNLETVGYISLDLTEQCLARIKVLANLRVDQHRLPQDGGFRFNSDQQKNIFLDIRVSIMPTRYGENAVLRLLGVRQKYKLTELGFGSMAPLERLKSNPKGLVIVCGPTGAGKTTTVYSLLEYLFAPQISCVTIEDPIEYDLSGVTQIQIHEEIGFSFDRALRSVLRQDPNIVMVGEVRDSETARIAATAALTGHLIISTVHTGDALSAIARLSDLGVASYVLSNTLNLIISQRLIPKLCQLCKAVWTPTQTEKITLETLFNYKEQVKLYTKTGCNNCQARGVSGRVAVFEMVVISEKLKQMIHDREPIQSISEQAKKEGFKNLLQNAYLKASQGLISGVDLLSLSYDR